MLDLQINLEVKYNLTRYFLYVENTHHVSIL